MSISSVGSTPVYTPPKAPTQAAPKPGNDADGDNDGTTSTQTASYANGTSVDVNG